MLRLKSSALLYCSVLLLLIVSATATAQEDTKKKSKVPQGTPVMWRDPGDVSSRNLLIGAGGEQMKPDLSKVTFIEEKTGGWSTKYRVSDGAGNIWIAKLSKEAQPDTSAARLLWALGYETEIAHLVPRLTIIGKGTFENVRLEARPKTIDRAGNWMWEDNPFKGKPEFQGLKILMVMINNWDMKDDNNEILATRGTTTGDLRYIISDLGATFGKTGGIISRSRNKPEDYVKAKFINKVNGNVIDFNYGGKMKQVFENITVADARWLSNLLGRLSDEQIKDAFRAANYSASDVDALARAFRQRINDLAAVAK
ncbi:MAG TPA: hypothetical protein VF251_14760 [Pyrinomonadaceae bacterium]